MPTEIHCPKCASANVIFSKKRGVNVCEDCGSELVVDDPIVPLRIFLSYGHDNNEELVCRIKADLEKRGHDVWFDKNEIKFGDEWRQSITDGILKSKRVLSFLSKYSTRDPGVCRDEIAIAIGVKGGNIQTILVESEQEVQPPVNIGHIQWLDMHDWKERFSGSEAAWEPWYQAKLAEIVRVVESDESRRFAGEIETLNGHLKPIKSDARIYQLLNKGFYGREWLFAAVENWRKDKNHDSRLFWIMGAPGVGKSAFAAQLTHMRGDTVIAAQFCEWDKPDHRNAQRVVRSLAFQIATQLPDYRKLLLTLPEIKDLDQKNPDELFDYLLAGPLRLSIDSGREKYLIVIDALDEAVEAGRNPLVEMLARNAQRLPDWIRFVITSRPEINVMAPLHGLKPFVFDTGTEANREDIRNYLSHELAPKLKDRQDASSLVEQILEKSEGVFLYVERFCDDIKLGHISLDHPEQFPQGIGGIFIQYFQRQFSNSSEYKASIRPILECICAQREPLPLSILAESVNLSETQLRELLAELGSLFPIRVGSSSLPTEDTVTSFHKSVIDWLTGKDELIGYFKAGCYVVDIEAGRKRLSDACWAQYQQSPYKMSVYALHHLPYHLSATERWKDLETILIDFGFMEAKLHTLGVYSLIEDYDLVHILGVGENVKRSGKSLSLIQGALRLSAHVLAQDKMQLPSQMTGRLLTFEYPEIKALLEQMKQWKGAPWLRPVTTSLTQPGGSLLLTMKGHTRGVNAVSVTPDGKRAISASNDNTLQVWDMESGVEIRTLKGHTDWVRAVSVTPDGRHAISGSVDNTLKVWDLDSGVEIRTLNGHTGEVRAVSVTPDGRHAISASEDHTLKIWDMESGVEIRTLKGHTRSVNAVSVTPDGRSAISASEDHTLKIWDMESGIDIRTLNGHTNTVWSVSVTPNGKRAISASFDSTLKVWDMESGIEIRTLNGHTFSVNSVSVTPDGRHAISASSDSTLRVWDMESGVEIRTLEGHTHGVSAVSVTPDGKRAISASEDDTLKVWDMESGIEPRTLKGHNSWINGVSVTPDGRHAISASSDSTLKVWDMGSGVEIRTLKGHNSWVSAVSVTPDGKRAISASNDDLKVWDVERGIEILTLVGHTHWVNAVSVTPDGRSAISASNDNTLKVWDIESGVEIRTMKGHTCGIRAVSVTPDGKRAISASYDSTLKVWDIESGVEIRTMKGHTAEVRAVSVTPDGRYAISASDENKLKVWDMESGRIIAGFCGDGTIYSCAIAPDGKTIVAGEYFGMVYLMHLENVINGVPIVTAWHLPCSPWWQLWQRNTAFLCSRCRTWSEIPASALGTEIPCPHCGKPVRLNPFTINSDWRPVAKAWNSSTSIDKKMD